MIVAVVFMRKRLVMWWRVSFFFLGITTVGDKKYAPTEFASTPLYQMLNTPD